MADSADRRAAAIAALSRAETQLRNAQGDQGANDRGWTDGFSSFLADDLAQSRGRIEEGWTPPPRYSFKWVRLLMDQITQPDEHGDALHSVVSVAAVDGGDVLASIEWANGLAP